MGWGYGGGALLQLPRVAGRGAPWPEASALADVARPAPLRCFPPSAATAVPEQGDHTPGHPTPQRRHPAAGGRRTHTPEVTQQQQRSQKGERARLQGAQGFMVTPPTRGRNCDWTGGMGGARAPGNGCNGRTWLSTARTWARDVAGPRAQGAEPGRALWLVGSGWAGLRTQSSGKCAPGGITSRVAEGRSERARGAVTSAPGSRWSSRPAEAPR